MPAAGYLSHGSAQDSAAGCWASGGGLSQLHTGLIKGYEQNRFPHILCSFARLRDPITFQVSGSLYFMVIILDFNSRTTLALEPIAEMRILIQEGHRILTLLPLSYCLDM